MIMKKQKMYVEPRNYFPPEVVEEFEKDFEKKQKTEKAAAKKATAKNSSKKWQNGIGFTMVWFRWGVKLNS